MSRESFEGRSGGLAHTDETNTSSNTSAKVRLVTPVWLRERRAAATALKVERAVSHANTQLLIPAAQHPLVEGVKPGKEFENRLAAALRHREATVKAGGRVAFFLTGNRHHDSATGQTDAVALYDAAGKWLLDEGVPAEELHGKDWIDASSKPQVYNGADEIRVAAEGYQRNARFSDARYFCAPGQSQRAEMYSLAYGLPADVVITQSPDIEAGEQFHAGLQHVALNGLTRTVDPYGTLLATRTQDRIPADGNMGTIPELLPVYHDLPWYNTQPQ